MEHISEYSPFLQEMRDKVITHHILLPQRVFSGGIKDLAPLNFPLQKLSKPQTQISGRSQADKYRYQMSVAGSYKYVETDYFPCR